MTDDKAIEPTGLDMVTSGEMMETTKEHQGVDADTGGTDLGEGPDASQTVKPAGVDTNWRDEDHSDLEAEFVLPGGEHREVPEDDIDGVLQTRTMDVFYGDFKAVADVSMTFAFNQISALIGPSGCGKSTVLRSLNRMNDLIPSAKVTGEVLYHGTNIYEQGVDPVEIRRRIGMVFQKPNPFPKSIFDNIAWGAKINGFKGSKSDLGDLVEDALQHAALWDEVKDKLKDSGLSLSGGQQQRLCIARAIATQPDVILMDEPCSALDPIATLRIEELMMRLKSEYSIIIVTHNMQQAARVSDRTAFFNVALNTQGQRTGHLVEFSPTSELFTTPREQATEDYITGRFG